MLIGELARLVGLRTSAIRHYESIGVLKPAARVAGRRRYGGDAVNTLRLLQATQQAGFTLAEARQLLPILADNRVPSKKWRDLFETKLHELDASIERLQTAREALVAAFDCACAGSAEDCKLVAATAPSRPKSERAAPKRRA
jgi:MerR family redox-sensitive transcriptional activator SoxR